MRNGELDGRVGLHGRSAQGHQGRAQAVGLAFLLAKDYRSAAEEFGSFVKRSREAARLKGTITERELEVLKLIGEGLTTRQMAGRLKVSQRTVESHIKNLYRKLEINSRVQAVAKAEELGLF